MSDDKFAPVATAGAKPPKAKLTASSKVRVKNVGTRPFNSQSGVIQPDCEGVVTLAEFQCSMTLAGVSK